MQLRAGRWLLVAGFALAGIALLGSGRGTSLEAASTAAWPSAATLREQAQPACPDAIGGLGITPFQQRSGNETSTQTLGCTYVAPVGSVGQARLLLRWNDPAGTVSQQCHSETQLREAVTLSAGNPKVTLWSATHQIQVEATIIQEGTQAGIAEAEAVAAAWLAEHESSAIPCRPDPVPIQAGSMDCPLRIGDLVWIGYYSSGPDVGKPAERVVGGETVPGLQLSCHYRSGYDDVDARGGIFVTWVEPDDGPPRAQDCRDFGREREVHSETRAAYASYEDPERYAAAASENQVREGMLALFGVAEARAAECPQAATVTPTETGTPAAIETAEPSAESCAPNGTVTDHRGDPMPGLRVQLHLGGEVADQRVTDASGAFRFAELDFLAESFGFDLANDEYQVGALLRDAVEGEARFLVRYGDRGVLPDVRSLPRTIAADPDCVVKIAFADINDEDYRIERGPADPTEWRSLAFSYQHLRIAWNFATDVLGVEMDALPLTLYAYCAGTPEGWWYFSGCGSDSAYYVSATTHDREDAGSPMIQLSRSFSRRVGGDRPINGEYHEVGHAVMSDAFGNLMPGRPDHHNHAGYSNPTSTDSWTEGFAEWFGAMVNREQGNTRWWLYPTGGLHSLESDRQARARGGKDEELSIAGILIDMVDSSADYTEPEERQLTLVQTGFMEDPRDESRLMYAVEFRNDTGTEQHDIKFRVEYGSVGGLFPSRLNGIVDPEVLSPGEVGRAVARLPASVRVGDVEDAVVVGFSTEDDDAVSHSPREVWDAIVSYRGTGEHGNGFVIDASELYEALVTGFPAETEAIDQIFINHGWFADIGTPPNGQYDEGEEIGVTSPDGARLRTAPERDAVFDATLDTGEVASRAFVQVLYSEPLEALSYAFTAPVDPETGTIALAVPPAETGAVVRIVLHADGYLPVVLDDIEAETFWEEAEANGYQPFLKLTATMVEGDPFAEESDSALSTPLLAGAAAVAMIVLAAGGRFALSRRRGAGS